MKPFFRYGIPSLLAFVVIDQVVWGSSLALTKSLYMDAQYYATWNPEVINLMAGTSFQWSSYAGVVLWTLFLAIPFVLWYRVMRDKLPGTTVKRGLVYGAMIYTTGALFMLLGASYMVSVPPAVLLVWVVTTLVEFLLQGIAVAYINKK